MRAVNLIPAEQRSGSAVGGGRSEGGAHALLAIVSGIAVLALLYGIAHHQIANRRAQTESVTAQAQQAQSAATQLAPYTSFVALREQRTQAVAQLVDSRFDWAHVFHEFGRVLPSDVSISGLTGTVGSTTASGSAAASAAPAAAAGAHTAGASTVSSATPPGSVPTFILTGCASSQPAVAQMLERLRLMDGVNTVTLQSSTKGQGGSTAGGCGPGAPVFSVQITFDPLPSAAAAAAAAVAASKTRVVSDAASAGSAPIAQTTTGTSSK